ncbi:MAG: hypothetical protein ACKV2U_33365 [Bryobacteraceae bacterium]
MTSERVHGIGRGNFMMANALMSALSLLAKVHEFLVAPDNIVSEAQKREAKALKSMVLTGLTDDDVIQSFQRYIDRRLKDPKTTDADRKTIATFESKTLNQHLDKNWRDLRVGDCDETKAFSTLIEALYSDGIDIGIPDKKTAEKVWGEFRNKLAHIAQPNQTVEVCAVDAGHNSCNPEAAIRSTGTAFKRDLNGWACNVDRLCLDIIEITRWLVVKLESHTDSNRSSDILKWLQSQGRRSTETTVGVGGTVTSHSSVTSLTDIKTSLPNPPPLRTEPR